MKQFLYRVLCPQQTHLSRLLVHKVLIWALVFSTIAPPVAWPQLAQPGLGGPQGSGAGAIGNAIVTDPRSMQSLEIPFLPCPAEVQDAGGATPPPVAIQPAAGGQGQPVPSSATPPISGAATPPVQQSPLALPGMKMGTQAGPNAQPGDPLTQISQEMLRQVGPERIGQMLLEQEFSVFLTSQGMTGQIKQFGYDFFKTPFLPLGSGTDIPVGPDYVLGPDDALSLHIWNVPDPNLNRTFVLTIERDGTVSIPQIGTIPITGATFEQANRVIHALLSSHLKRFDMHLAVARLRTMKVFVVGEVVRPGAYDVSSLGTVSHALYASCGPAKTGSLRRIQLIRAGKMLSELDFYQFLVRGDRTQDVRLQSGDTILVPPIGQVAGIGGAVKRPGIYEFRDKATLSDLISVAGGLNAMAARKRCQLFRVQSGQQRMILDVPLEGNLPESPREPTGIAGVGGTKDGFVLQDGDFVRIPSTPMQVENAVSLTGAVRDPGQYEFRPGMKLLDLLTPTQMMKDSHWERAELIRVDPLTYEIAVTPFSPRAALQGKSENFELRRLDKIVVATQIKTPRTVTLKGEFWRTGTYVIQSGEKLSSVLRRAGGVTPRAFIPGLILTRASIRQTQQSEIETFIAFQKRKLIGDAASLAFGAMQVGQASGAETSVLQLQLQALDQLAARIQPGRVVIRIASLQGLQDSSEDIILEDGDQIAVPEYPQTISILGAVRNPTSLVYEDKLAAEDYLQKAGGITKDGNPKDLYLVRADGSVETGYMQIKSVSPGDTIVVPYTTEPKLTGMQFWGALSQSFGGIVAMVTAALAILVIGRNR